MSAEPVAVVAGSYCTKPGSRREASAKMLASIERSTGLKPITSTRYCSFRVTSAPLADQAEYGIRIAEPALLLFAKHAVHQRLQVRQVGGQARGSGEQVLRQHLLQGLAGERGLAAKHLVQQHAQAVDVGRGPGGRALQLLRSDVARSSMQCAGNALAVHGAGFHREAEVAEHHGAVFAQQEVG